MKVKIATRNSPLALWQAEHVKARLVEIAPSITVDLVRITTHADKFLETRLQKIGGKGLFVKELEEALLSKEADIAVHSMKDVPYELPDGLEIKCVLLREDPRDALISAASHSLAMLPKGAVVGTSSLRRECQLKRLRPDINVVPIRGNVQTRLKKVDNGELDAIVLAMAGLERLELRYRVSQIFEPIEMLPAVGQGIIGVELARENHALVELLAHLNDPTSDTCIRAERAMNKSLGGSCHLPVAGFAEIRAGKLVLEGLVGSVSTGSVIRETMSADIGAPEILGQALAAKLIEQGAQSLIDEAKASE